MGLAMPGPIYRHEQQTRRPAMYLAAAVALIMAGFAAFQDAPWFFYLPVLFALLLSAWGIAFNRRSGIVVGSSEIELYSGSWRRSLAVADVRGYRATSWSEGADWLYLLLDDGEDVLIPTASAGPTTALRAALESVGIQKRQ